MSEYNIRRSGTDSVSSVNKEKMVSLALDSTSKLLMLPNFIETVDAYEVFKEERNECEKYRIVITINPYCSNVLFNALTEVVKDEGSEDVEVVYDGETAKLATEAYGNTSPTRQEMIMNTEYSRNDIGYVYHPGLDIFDNHILRNQTFRVVNKKGDKETSESDTSFCDSSSPSVDTIFNTIGDYMRYSDGTIVKYTCRTSISDGDIDEDNARSQHLYSSRDYLLSYEESVEENLSEENGWFGFTNNATISSKGYTESEDRKTGLKIWEDLDIGHVLNNYGGCEFIDMYPDRSLFSFFPKVNTYRKRLEYNWDVILTYPYRCDYDYDIVKSTNGTKGLKLFYITKTRNSAGGDVLIFRSFVRHNVSKNDYITLYCIKDNTTTEMEDRIKVSGVGNLTSENDGNKEYFFYTTDMSLLTDILGLHLSSDSDTLGEWFDEDDNNISDSEISEELRNYEFRFARYINGVNSKYYLRIFRKVPNFRRKRSNLTEDIASDYESFRTYLLENAMESEYEGSSDVDKGVMLGYNKEEYRLAFSKTIYNDDVAQIVFTEDVDLEHIKDNLGRPLSEIYVTILKANRGYGKWYGVSGGIGNDAYTYSEPEPEDENVEFSHCFGRVSSGFEFLNLKADSANENNIRSDKMSIGDIRLQSQLASSYMYENDITEEKSYNTEAGEYIYNEFIGDIVELAPCYAKEYILEKVQHRFNTAQRELGSDNKAYSTFAYEELSVDDYEYGSNSSLGHTVTRTTVGQWNDDYNNTFEAYQRPEGYYFSPHYSIPIKEWGSIEQGSHHLLSISSATPIQADGIFISITTKRKHGLSRGDYLYVCIDDVDREIDDEEYEGNFENDVWYMFVATYVTDSYTFAMAPYDMTWAEFTAQIKEDTGCSYNWINLSLALSSTDTTTRVYLRRRNSDIPDYAIKVGHNIFLWRDIISIGDSDATELPEYPYANNAFYLNKEINFYLKRQDGERYTGVYAANAFPADVKGKRYTEDTYVYKSEDETGC